MKQDIMLIVPQAEHLSNICKALEFWGLHTSKVDTIDGARAKLMVHSPAFLLVDIDMAGARQFVSDISKSFLYPPPYIIISSILLRIEDYFIMLDFGADACVGKPIKAQEILAIVNSVLRRERKIARRNLGRLDSCIRHKDLIIDPLRRTVTMRKQTVKLTAKEFDVLHLLACHAGSALSRKEIYEAVWGEEYSLTAANVAGYIFALRKKLGLSQKDDEYIQTVFGVGYRFADRNI